MLTVLLLLCLAGCRALSDPIASHEIPYRRDTQSHGRTAELRLLSSPLSFGIRPDMELDRRNSFDRYNPKFGDARLQRTQQDARGTFPAKSPLPKWVKRDPFQERPPLSAEMG